jgi:hypothetical protein
MVILFVEGLKKLGISISEHLGLNLPKELTRSSSDWCVVGA